MININFENFLEYTFGCCNYMYVGTMSEASAVITIKVSWKLLIGDDSLKMEGNYAIRKDTGKLISKLFGNWLHKVSV